MILGWEIFCPDYMLEYYEERAAIMEFDGECSHERAEELAYLETIQKWWGPKPHATQ